MPFSICVIQACKGEWHINNYSNKGLVNGRKVKDSLGKFLCEIFDINIGLFSFRWFCSSWLARKRYFTSQIKQYDWNDATVDQKGPDPHVMATLLRWVVKLYCPRWQLSFQRGSDIWAVLLFVISPPTEQPVMWMLQPVNQDSPAPLIHLEPPRRKHFWLEHNIGPNDLSRQLECPLARIGNAKIWSNNFEREFWPRRYQFHFWTILRTEGNGRQDNCDGQLWTQILTITLRER